MKRGAQVAPKPVGMPMCPPNLTNILLIMNINKLMTSLSA
jgi:hypothetical protein